MSSMCPYVMSTEEICGRDCPDPTVDKCTLHSERKNPATFRAHFESLLGKISEDSTSDSFDFSGLDFPDDRPVFRGHQFDKDVYFTAATFRELIDFSEAVFSKGAYFKQVGCRAPPLLSLIYVGCAAGDA